MRRVALLLPAFAALPLPLGAQEVRQQGAALTLPAYTESQLWEGLSGNFTAFVLAGISQAKSLGDGCAPRVEFATNVRLTKK
jgi:hypothetical protein